ncbi:hypothetical protein V1477_002582 [Vespula maculifrons]|uniref:Uncharacterized protein n=1 Tax=Vespula maculifrons TaxID=7453 RepID=A0ABD2CV68_VESMC
MSAYACANASNETLAFRITTLGLSHPYLPLVSSRGTCTGLVITCAMVAQPIVQSRFVQTTFTSMISSRVAGHRGYNITATIGGYCLRFPASGLPAKTGEVCSIPNPDRSFQKDCYKSKEDLTIVADNRRRVVCSLRKLNLCSWDDNDLSLIIESINHAISRQ